MTPPVPPLMGSAAQLEALARVLLGCRSALEGVVLTLAEPTPATVAAATRQTHGIIDQLDAAFVIVGALQATADMGAVGATIDTTAAPAAEGGKLQTPPTFGSKRRAAAAEATAQTSSPVEAIP